MPTRTLRGFSSSTVRPADFDAFWSETLANLARVPANAEFVRDEMRSDRSVDVFDVRYDSYGGLRIAGWYARPAGRDSGLPGLLTVPGYVSEPKIPKDWARRGYAAFAAAPRGKLRSNAVFNPGYPGLLMHNITDRERYAYRGFFMDAVRAFDILSERPEVDGARVGVTGSSQGGALTLLIAALRPGAVAVAAAGAPYLCSYMDAASLTHSYPYEEINEHLRLHPEREPDIKRVFDYYDIHNFAPAIVSPVVVNIGLQDDVCPPETGFAVFEQIGSGDKKLYPYDRCAHDAGSLAGHEPVVRRFFAEHLEPVPVSPARPRAAGARISEPPLEFDRYWAEVDAEVRGLSFSGVQTVPLALRSTEGSQTYAVRLPSVDGGEAFGYFSVPNGDGPFPGLVEAPGYGSVVHISPYERRQRFAVLTLVHRGQRLADERYAAAYPGLLTDGITDAARYRYRGIVSDVLTGLDWLAGRPEVDLRRFAIAGSEAGFISASMRPSVVSTSLLNGPLLLRNAGGRGRWPDDYPLEELNDFARSHPESVGKMAATLALYDPIRFAPNVAGDALIACGEADVDVASPLRAACGGLADLYVNTGRGFDDHEYTETWLSERLSG